MRSIGIVVSKTKEYPTEEDVKYIAEKEREVLSDEHIATYRMFSWGDVISFIRLKDYPSSIDYINKLIRIYKTDPRLKKIGFVESRLIYGREIGGNSKEGLPDSIIISFFKKSLTSPTYKIIDEIKTELNPHMILYPIGWESIITVVDAKNISNTLYTIERLNKKGLNSHSIVAFIKGYNENINHAIVSLKVYKDIGKDEIKKRLNAKGFSIFIKPGWFDVIIEIKDKNINDIAEIIEKIRNEKIAIISHTVTLLK